MIGNDIVDLKLAEVESNWKRDGYLDKIYSPLEQKMISESSKPDLLIWRLWSMKESAYKAWHREGNSRKLNPLSFSCELISEDDGIVSCDTQLYHTRTEFSDDFVHTHAFSDDFNQEFTIKLINLKSDQSSSEAFYDKVISSLSQSKGWYKKDIRIKKNSLGIPDLYRFKRKTVLISLSHHGRFGSYLVTN